MPLLPRSRRVLSVALTIAAATVVAAVTVGPTAGPAIADAEPAVGQTAGPALSDAGPGTLQLVARTGAGDHLAVVGEATAYPGAEVRRFATEGAARAAATTWTVLERGDGQFQLQLVRASGTRACLIPHTHAIGGTSRGVVITTYCDASAPEQRLSAADGALRFAAVPTYEQAGAWLDVRTASEAGAEYLLRSDSPATGWLGLPGDGGDEQRFSAEWSFQQRDDQPSVLSGTGTPGATVTAVTTDGSVAAGPVPVGENGSWQVEVPAPDRAGVFELSAVQTAAGVETDRHSVSLDYGSAVQITTPVAGAVIGSGPVQVSGLGEPGAAVEVSLPGRQGVTVVVGPDGRWSTTIP